MDVIQPTPTSRLCVKNLPKHVDEPRLKEHFSSKGEVTDVKIIRTKDGKSRMFGFVGYKTDQAAQAAQKFFDRTFFDTSRISVEYARKVGDSEVRPWSKYSDGSSKHQKLAEQQNATTDGSKDKNGKKGSAAEPAQEDVDEKFAEFLQLMQPRSKSKLWSNDTMMSDGVAAGKQAAPGAGKAAAAGKAGKAAAAAGKAAARKAAAGDELSSDDEAGTSDDENDYQDLAAGQQGRAADADASQGSEDADEDEDEDEQQPKVDSGNDLDYLKSRMTVKSFDDDDDDAFLQRAGVPGAGAAAEPSAPSDDPEADEMESDDADADEDEAGSSDVDSDTDLQHDAAARGDQSGVGTSAAATSKQQAKAAKLAAAMGIELPEAPEAEAADMDVDAPQQEQQQPPQQQAGRGDVIAADDAVSIIQDTGRLFLRNLAYSATETDLTELFSTFGPVEEAHVVLDKLSKHSKGIAYVLFRLPEDAVRAFQELDGQIFQGRLLHILPARKPPSQEAPAQAAGKDGSFKDKREQERKADAGACGCGWCRGQLSWRTPAELEHGLAGL
jgi:multiple RNA-binding domain-containing protein 1